jgi:antitoxin VapB
MPRERHVKVFRNGRNQAIRIPREFELPGEDAILRKEGDRLILEPPPNITAEGSRRPQAAG